MNLQVVHIISTANSGSTWVNLILGSHPDAFSVGELKMAIRPGLNDCTVHGCECPVLSKFDPHTEENPFLQLQRLTGKSIFIVNNSRKFLPAQMHDRIQSRFVHLARDGRAVTASYLRKRRQPDMWHAARRWVHEVKRDRRLMQRLRRQPNCRLHYEAMVAHPLEQLEKLCSFIGIDCDHAMLRYWEHEHHFFGGNRGTLFAMLKKHDPSAEAPPAPSTSPTGQSENLQYYAQTNLASFDDQRWKQQLTARQLWVFRLLAGRTNHAIGYSSGPDPHPDDRATGPIISGSRG